MFLQQKSFKMELKLYHRTPSPEHLVGGDSLGKFFFRVSGTGIQLQTGH